MTRESTKKAIESYILKHTKDVSKLKRKHNRPEKEVEKQVMSWCRDHNIFANVVESKAVYSAAAGRYLSGQASAGFPDIVAINNLGRFLAIELKSPGRRSTIRPNQYDFLIQVISLNGFACVTDSVSHLSSLYFSWLNSPDALKKSVLLNDLPKKKADDLHPLFED